MSKNSLIIFFVILFSFISLNYVSSFSASIDIPEKYVDVFAGEKVYFEVEIEYPENLFMKDLILNYEILNQEGNRVAQAKLLKMIETQLSFVDSMLIPSNSKEGLYFIRLIIEDDNSLKHEVETSFYVLDLNITRSKMYFFILFGVFLFVGFLSIMNIFVVVFLFKKSWKIKRLKF